MLKEETIQQIKDMLERSQSHDVIAHCDYLIENNKDEDKLVIAQLFYIRGNAYRQLMSSYL